MNSLNCNQIVKEILKIFITCAVGVLLKRIVNIAFARNSRVNQPAAPIVVPQTTLQQRAIKVVKLSKIPVDVDPLKAYQAQKGNALVELPPELLQNIARFLDSTSYCRMMQTCRFFLNNLRGNGGYFGVLPEEIMLKIMNQLPINEANQLGILSRWHYSYLPIFLNVLTQYVYDQDKLMPGDIHKYLKDETPFIPRQTLCRTYEDGAKSVYHFIDMSKDICSSKIDLKLQKIHRSHPGLLNLNLSIKGNDSILLKKQIELLPKFPSITQLSIDQLASCDSTLQSTLAQSLIELKLLKRFSLSNCLFTEVLSVDFLSKINALPALKSIEFQFQLYQCHQAVDIINKLKQTVCNNPKIQHIQLFFKATKITRDQMRGLTQIAQNTVIQLTVTQ